MAYFFSGSILLPLELFNLAFSMYALLRLIFNDVANTTSALPNIHNKTFLSIILTFHFSTFLVVYVSFVYNMIIRTTYNIILVFSDTNFELKTGYMAKKHRLAVLIFYWISLQLPPFEIKFTLRYSHVFTISENDICLYSFYF